MPRTKLEELLVLQKNHMGTMLRAVTNFKKLGKERLARDCLKVRLETLESYWSQVLRTHFAISEFDNINDTDYIKQDLFSEAESHYIATKGKINELLEKELATEQANNKISGNSEGSLSELPKVGIPEFDGDISKWEYFRDSFLSLIHNDQRIPPVKKMHYLKGCLKGDAATSIGRIPLTAENYESTWEFVMKRYDNPLRRLDSDLQNLFETEPLTETTAEGISAVMGSVHQLVRSLDKVEDIRDCIYLYALKRRLDPYTKQHWARSHSNTRIPKYEELQTFLTQWISSLEIGAATIRKTSESKPTKSKNNSRDNKSRGRKELSVNATDITKDAICLMCKEGHALVKCRKFQELPSWRRREQVRKLRACFRCLGPNHSMARCSSTIRCRHCQGEHNSLLHLGPVEVAQEHSNVPDSSSAGSKGAGPTQVTSMATSTSGTVLLATARVRLISGTGESFSVRALLDSASEASFVTERVVQQLALPRRKADVIVSGLQGLKIGPPTQAVSLRVGSEYSAKSVYLPTAFVLPNLTSFKPGQRICRWVPSWTSRGAGGASHYAWMGADRNRPFRYSDLGSYRVLSC